MSPIDTRSPAERVREHLHIAEDQAHLVRQITVEPRYRIRGGVEEGRRIVVETFVEGGAAIEVAAWVSESQANVIGYALAAALRCAVFWTSTPVSWEHTIKVVEKLKLKRESAEAPPSGVVAALAEAPRETVEHWRGGQKIAEAVVRDDGTLDPSPTLIDGDSLVWSGR